MIPSPGAWPLKRSRRALAGAGIKGNPYYPSLRDADIDTALQYAAEVARERIVPLAASA